MQKIRNQIQKRNTKLKTQQVNRYMFFPSIIISVKSLLSQGFLCFKNESIALFRQASCESVFISITLSMMMFLYLAKNNCLRKLRA